MTSKTHKGVTYFQDFNEARSICASILGSRVVRYERGWAVDGPQQSGDLGGTR